MVAFIEIHNCKICKKKGTNIYKKKYTDKNLIFFLREYYGDNKYELLKKRLADSNFSLLKCDNCNFIWQENSPDDKFTTELYDEIIDKEKSLNKSELKFKNHRFSNRKEITFISKQFSYIKKINILDFGAGWGHWLNSGNKEEFNPYAFELSSERKKYLLNLGINIIDSNVIDKYENFFHYIRIDQVLEHVYSLQKTLRVLKKLAKKDCLFYLSVPDGSKILSNKSKIEIKKGPIQPLEHLNCFSRNSLNKLLSQEGFVNITLLEIFFMHMKILLYGKINLSLFLKDIRDCFVSTSIKFKIK